MDSQDEALQFARSEFSRIFIQDAELRALCNERTRQFLPDGAAAAPIVRDKIVGFLRNDIPASLLRVGDGEGGALGMAKTIAHPAQTNGFYDKIVLQNGCVIPEQDAVFLCKSLREALVAADIIGFRSFRFCESEVIEQLFEGDNIKAGLNLLYARELLQNGLLEQQWTDTIVTSAWIHLDLLPYLDDIIDAANSIIVITGRPELRTEAASRLGSRLEDFITVPAEKSVPSSAKDSHYYSAYPSVLKRLDRNLRGKLVLAGAGFFAKVYCHVAKLNGAVALDLGSAFDVLAGLNTRPAHANHNIDALRWI